MHLLSISALAALALAPTLGAARSPSARATAARADLLAGHLLPAGTTVRIRDGAGARVSVDQGVVWITEQGSFVDLVIGAGESCPLDRDGDALIAVHEQARLRLALGPARPRTVEVKFARGGDWLPLP